MAGPTRTQARVQQDGRGVSGNGIEPIKVHTRTLSHVDLTAAATTQTISIATGDDGIVLPAAAMIIRASVQTLVAPAGGSVAVLTTDVGDAGDVDELLDGANIFAVGYVQTPAGVYTPFTRESAAYGAQALFTCDVNLDLITRGTWRYRIYYLCPEAPLIPS